MTLRFDIGRGMTRALRALLALAAALLVSTPAAALLLEVNSNSDSGEPVADRGDGFCSTGGTVTDPVLGVVPECTLRAAIEESNAWNARDQIVFGNPVLYDAFTDTVVFSPATAYQTITDPVDIDGTTAPTWSAGLSPRIRIDGQSFLTGLVLGGGSADSTVKGLAFMGFSTGIRLDGSDGAQIDSSSFGLFRTPPFGDETVNGNTTGIQIEPNSPNSIIGARFQAFPLPSFVGNGNVIADSTYGIQVEAENTSINGNFIGTDFSGLRTTSFSLPFGGDPLGNAYGIRVENGSGINIGTVVLDSPFPVLLAKKGNVISGNAYGVWITENVPAGPSPMQILHNKIGTDVNGEGDLGNTTAGVHVTDANNDISIGSVFGGNTISGTDGDGIGVFSGTSGLVTIQSNRIGLSTDGTEALGNDGHGIYARAGATVDISLNTIGHSGEHGIFLDDLFGDLGDVTIESNQIGADADGNLFGNVGAGIHVEHVGAEIRDNTIGGNQRGIDLGDDSASVELLSNYIGTNPSSADLGNLLSGIRSTSLDGDHRIGRADQGNVIGWNDNHGIVVFNATLENVIVGNMIGASGTGDRIGNDRHGIVVRDGGAGSSRVVIGSRVTTPSNNFANRENRIAFNAFDGISLQRDAWAEIRGNRMRENGHLAIDLNANGATANDDGDGDGGANWTQNFPVIDSDNSSLDEVTGEIDIEYRVESDTTDSDYDLSIDFYLADVDGLEPRRWIGEDQYQAGNANQQQAIRFVPNVPIIGEEMIVATATDANGRTSEVSAPITVPEPTPAMGLLSGVLGFCCVARRRRKEDATLEA